jgi:hypothetical protein
MHGERRRSGRRVFVGKSSKRWSSPSIFQVVLSLPIFSFLIKLALPTLARLFEIVSLEKNCFWRAAYHTGEWRLSDVFCIALFPYGRNGRHSPVWYGRKNRVTIFLNGQFIIVYTIQVIKYSPVIITSRIFSFKMLYFGWWERSWLNLYNRYDHMESRLNIYLENCGLRGIWLPEKYK